MGKNLLQKLGIVEDDELVDLLEVSSQGKLNVKGPNIPMPTYEPVSTIKGEECNISEIYEKTGKKDLSKSIFTIEGFKKALPETMSSDTKKASVIGILGVSGLNLEELLTDASERVDILQTNLDNCSQETIILISQNNQKIDELNAQIDNLKSEIETRKKLQENFENVINGEINRINSIVGFIK